MAENRKLKNEDTCWTDHLNLRQFFHLCVIERKPYLESCKKAGDSNRALIVARPMGLKLWVIHKYENQVCSLVKVVVQMGVRSVHTQHTQSMNSSRAAGTSQPVPTYIRSGFRQWPAWNQKTFTPEHLTVTCAQTGKTILDSCWHSLRQLLLHIVQFLSLKLEIPIFSMKMIFACFMLTQVFGFSLDPTTAIQVAEVIFLS